MRFRPGMPLLFAVASASAVVAALWPLPLERPRCVIEGEKWLITPSFASDGRSFITGAAHDILVSLECRDARTGRTRWTVERDPVEPCGSSADGQQLALIDTRGSVEIRAALSGVVLQSIKLSAPSDAIAFAADGKLIYLDPPQAAVRYAIGDEPAYAWDGPASGWYRLGDFLITVSIDAGKEDSDWARFGQCKLVHMPTGKLRRSPVLKAPAQTTYRIPWKGNCSADGSVLLLRLVDKTHPGARWQVVDTETWETRDIKTTEESLALSADGTVFATKADSDPGASRPPRDLETWPARLRRWLGVREVRDDEWISLRSMVTGEEIARIPGQCVTFSPDGHTLAVGGDGYLELWDYPLRPAWLLRLSIAAAVGVVTWGLLRWRRFKASRAA